MYAMRQLLEFVPGKNRHAIMAMNALQPGAHGNEFESMSEVTKGQEQNQTILRRAQVLQGRRGVRDMDGLGQ